MGQGGLCVIGCGLLIHGESCYQMVQEGPHIPVPGSRVQIRIRCFSDAAKT